MKKLLLLCGIVLILSGCAVKGDFKLSINKDKTVDFGITIAYDDELIETLMSMNSSEEASEEIEYTDEQKWEFVDTLFEDDDNSSPESSGFVGERYQEEDYKGYTYTKNVGDIDSITADEADFDATNNYLDISESKLFIKNGNNYVSKIVFTPAEETDGYQIDSNITFTVTLPNKPISHNADSVSEDGKTLTWNLTTNSQQAIDFEFSFLNLPLIIAISGVCLLVIIVVIVLVVKGKKRSKTPVSKTNEVNAETVSTPINLEQINQVTSIENNQLSSETNEVKSVDLNQKITSQANVQTFQQQENTVSNLPEDLNQVNLSTSVNVNSTPNAIQANVDATPSATVQTSDNLENVTMQNPKMPDQSFLNSSNTKSVEKSTAPTVEDLLNSMPKRDN